MFTNFDDFILEKYGSHKYVRELTDLLFNKIKAEFGKLLLNKSISIENFLQDNYKSLIFINDTITVKLSDRNYGGTKIYTVKNNTLLNVDINFEIKLSDEEIDFRFLNIHNDIKYTINHEFMHVIEEYETQFKKIKLSTSWDIGERLFFYKNKYIKFDAWDDILHLIYLSLPHEMRAKVSQMYEYLESLKLSDKNEYVDKIKNSIIYKDADFITNVDIIDILKIMRNEYSNFDEMLKEFMVFVLEYKGNNYEKEFISYFKKIQIKNEKFKEKLLKSYYFVFKSSYILEDDFDRIINYSKYLKSDE